MTPIFICIGIAVVCFALYAMMGSNDRNKLEDFKNSNPTMYQKYKQAFDSAPSDFTGVLLTVGTIDSKLLPGEGIVHSYFLPRFYGKDSNLFLLTDKRLMYVGMKLTNTEIKTILMRRLKTLRSRPKPWGLI